MAASRNERRWIPSPMSATPNRDPLTISIIRLMPSPVACGIEPSSRGSAPNLAAADPAPADRRAKPRAWSRVTSPVGTPLVPSFGFSRLIVNPFGDPSSESRGTMKVARPLLPGGAPSGGRGR